MSSRVLVPVAAHEVLRELEEITRRAASPNREAAKGDLDRVRRLVAALPSEWRTGKMLYTLGAAFGELGEFEEAIGYYQAAIRAPGTDEEVPFRTIEQLANLQVRYADELHRRAQAGAEVGSAVQAADGEETRAAGCWKRPSPTFAALGHRRNTSAAGPDRELLQTAGSDTAGRSRARMRSNMLRISTAKRTRCNGTCP